MARATINASTFSGSRDRTLLASLAFADPDKRELRHDLACHYVGTRAADLVSTYARPPSTPRPRRVFGIDDRDDEDAPGAAAPSPVTLAAFEKCATTVAALNDDIARERAGLPVGWRRELWFRAPERSDLRSRIAVMRNTWTTLPMEICIDSTQCEVHLTKGTGQYATTVGFLDVVIVARMRHPMRYFELDKALQRVDEATAVYEEHRTVLVEVKITPCSSGDLLRQINLYRMYTPDVPGAYFMASWLAVVDFDVTPVFAQTMADAKVHLVRLGAGFDVWVSAQSAAAPAQIDSL